MKEKEYDCFLLGFNWRENVFVWNPDGFFEDEQSGVQSFGSIPSDACNFKIVIRKRKE